MCFYTYYAAATDTDHDIDSSTNMYMYVYYFYYYFSPILINLLLLQLLHCNSATACCYFLLLLFSTISPRLLLISWLVSRFAASLSPTAPWRSQGPAAAKRVWYVALQLLRHYFLATAGVCCTLLVLHGHLFASLQFVNFDNCTAQLHYFRYNSSLFNCCVGVSVCGV